jgi:hypothetical protein
MDSHDVAVGTGDRDGAKQCRQLERAPRAERYAPPEFFVVHGPDGGPPRPGGAEAEACLARHRPAQAAVREARQCRAAASRGEAKRRDPPTAHAVRKRVVIVFRSQRHARRLFLVAFSHLVDERDHFLQQRQLALQQLEQALLRHLARRSLARRVSASSMTAPACW